MLAFAKDITKTGHIHSEEDNDPKLKEYMDYQRKINHEMLVYHSLDHAKIYLQRTLDSGKEEEIKAYGRRILNVHIKDRILHGTTVPLGQGNADIPKVLKELDSIGYNGNFILQTARAVDENHTTILSQYRDQFIKWME